MRSRWWIATVGCALSVLSPSARADVLFESNELLEVRLSGPLRELARDRDEKPAYRPGILTYPELDGTDRTLEVKLRPRGKSRRGMYCQFPPLRLKVPKNDVDGTLFEKQNNLKLVTHCKRSDRHDRFIYREYLVYRMLNLITRTSFRVRPLVIEYVDTAQPDRSERRFGFLLEDKKRLAKRLERKEAKVAKLSPSQLEPAHTSLMDLFQFMVANTDFSFISPWGTDDCCHNTTLLSDPSGAYLPVPYDFDVTGFVDAPYAVVDQKLPIADVRKRLFRGFCRPDDSLARAVARLQAVRAQIFEVLRTETMLEERDRASAERFIAAFYALLDNPADLQRKVLGACRAV